MCIKYIAYSEIRNNVMPLGPPEIFTALSCAKPHPVCYPELHT